MAGRSRHAPLFVLTSSGVPRWLRWGSRCVAAIVAVGCGHSGASPPPGFCAGLAEDGALSGIEVKRPDDRPSVALVVREGDPRGAVAAVVVTAASSYASTGLAALVEARLQRAGFAQVASRADRDSFRVRVLVDTKERAAELVNAFQKALAQPVSSGEMALVARRIASLKRHPFEAPIVASIARCTGELGALASEPVPQSSVSRRSRSARCGSLRGLWRDTHLFGAAGNAAFTASVADAVRSGDSLAEGLVTGNRVAFGRFDRRLRGRGPSCGQRSGHARVSTRRAETAVATASVVGTAEGALSARLRALSVPFRVLESSATARSRGGCVAVTMETARPARGSGLEEAAALAAKIARQEIERAQAAIGPGMPRARLASSLGYEGAKAVRAASDPRDAAELAALWSLTTPASSDDKETLATGLALAPPNLDPRDPNADLAGPAQGSTQRFSAAMAQLEKAWSTPVLERRERVEPGKASCGLSWQVRAVPRLKAMLTPGCPPSR